MHRFRFIKAQQKVCELRAIGVAENNAQESRIILNPDATTGLI